MNPFFSWKIFSGRAPQNGPLVISGPCSAESEQQLLSTVRAISSENRVHAIRAGIWKPRTRPDSFEGIGAPALSWLTMAGKQSGLPTMTEVANALHVEQALNAGVDMLWIGARTTVNPFFVQEIADALKGVDVPVFVKNPIHPEIGLWLGAIERLEKVGIVDVAAIHRGFYAHRINPFRNDPKWEMSIELRAERPDIPIICDPSHISGKRDYIAEVSQTALDLQLDGLMIESHINPEKALSDAEQQLRPHQLNQILSSLIVRDEDITDVATVQRLEQLRGIIDQIDQQLVEVIGRRKEIVELIGEVKKENNVAILQFHRWFEILKNRTEQAEALGIDGQFVNELYHLIHKFSIDIQQQMMVKKEFGSIYLGDPEGSSIQQP
ncbi:MAG: bifunctional 3-deoxy-7-phosphoheptulonate synthase/chorismate mutase type II [Cryomorphaceae bacterium]|nr:bifunctional 3-deoxy-7-phosphoheptulonate synthase/chorismate mutase type II [Cryomorphaceae bacterium]